MILLTCPLAIGHSDRTMMSTRQSCKQRLPAVLRFADFPETTISLCLQSFASGSGDVEQDRVLRIELRVLRAVKSANREVCQ